MRIARKWPVVIIGPVVVAITLWADGRAYAECSQAQRTSGVCQSVTTDIDGGGVTITREESSPGQPGTTTTGAAPGGSSGANRSSPPPRQEARLGSSECAIRVQGLCRGGSPAKNSPAAQSEQTPPTPPRYASELESFRPDRPAIRIEPQGWSVPRLPTNMVAVATVHRKRGELLGWPVEVRFTPVDYHWNFGDGSRRSTSDAGALWSQRGVAQFSATPTAHRYDRPGRYRVSLRVDYRVEFRFEGESFGDIDGEVSRDAPSQTVEVLTVSPLLVEGTG